jgi:hypothetical protein
MLDHDKQWLSAKTQALVVSILAPAVLILAMLLWVVLSR